MYQYICTRCGKKVPVTTHAPCCECGGLFELDFTPPAFSEDLIDRSCWNIFRYRAFMPLLDDAYKSITLGEGMTPIVAYDEHLLIKMDYCMPTLSFKDRGAATLIAHAKAIGVTSCVQDSSGNAGNSVAAYCARAGIDCDIYVPEATSPKKIDMIKAHGARAHVIEGSRDHCADVCRAAVKEAGKYYANHVYNPYFYEGTKTYIYETFEQLHRLPETIFLPLGNGTLFIGAVKACEHLLQSGVIEKMPTLVAIQSEHCAPFAKAVELGLEHIAQVTPKATLAEGIAIGVPMRGDEILAMIRRYAIEVVEVKEDSILASRAALARAGIYCEHTTAANYSAYLQYCQKHGQVNEALITMCGAGLKSDH